MQDLIIEVDILCEWQTEPPSYRLYIDHDLYTERTYIWRNPNQWVREKLIAELAPGIHVIKILPVIKQVPAIIHQFGLENLTINNKYYTLQNSTFTV